MSHGSGLTLHYAAGSDIGQRRELNEDSAYASPRMLALADGIGGHVHGEIASAAVIAALTSLDARLPAADLHQIDLSAALATGVADASQRLVDLAERDPALQGMGTTLTAMLWDGVRFAVAHVGDSRGYVLRDGALAPLTSDHTFVQALVDDGVMAPEEVAGHPRRSLLLRALLSTSVAEPDLSVRDGRAGDRYLLCSDGLTDYVPLDAVGEVLAGAADPATAVRGLIDLANSYGGPDNITCVVADLDQSAGRVPPQQSRIVVGALAELAAQVPRPAEVSVGAPAGDQAGPEPVPTGGLVGPASSRM